MFSNYLKTAWRNLSKNKTYTAINVGGLAVGVAACILLFIVVNYELSYDTFQPNYKNIYHVVTTNKYRDGLEYTAGIPFPALEALRADFPQITTGVLYSNNGSQVAIQGNRSDNTSSNKFIEPSGMFFADPQFFEVFQYQWLINGPAVLKEPNVTVLTKKMAEKYFGDWHQAVGKFLKLDNKAELKVAGILNDVPANTDFPLGVVTSYETMKNYPDIYGYTTTWGRTTSSNQIFMLLSSSESTEKLNAQLKQFSKKYYTDEKPGTTRWNSLQPLRDIHFDERFGNLGDHVSSKSILLTLSLIGVFIILMACINFINLSTALAANRSKEIGIRKVLGSNRRNLFWQMMCETALIVGLSVIVAAAIAKICLPYIRHIDSINEPLDILTVKTVAFFFLLAVAVTLFAGLYPSLILSGFSPILAIKNKITSATVGGISLRRGLVIAQFAISQVLIIGTIVAISQMNFVRSADLGFNKKAILVLNANADSAFISKQDAFKQSLLQLPGVQAVSFSSDVPSSDNNWGTSFAYNHQRDEDFTLFFKCADADYFKTFGLQFAAGHGYKEGDSVNDVVINETLVEKLGLKNPDDAIGTQIRMGKDEWKTVVGVIKDFKTNSLRDQIEPILIKPKKRFYSVTSVKLTSSNLAQIKEAIEKTWDRFYPEYANTSSFMDENINNFYRQEDQLSLLYKIFAGIAIFISCLGLYGLVSFMAVQRTKEVGIRKVLGASASNIMYLFSREFALLVIIAFIIAAPFAWYMTNNWLQNFRYRIKLGIGVFALAILISVIIALITVGYNSLKAAIANPVKSLRAE
ncbi:MAG: ABC transporter permease [Bacteroidetes bacterium]|nr:MAG: ABC transporter permease [Bacteroidota bacterium]